MAITLIQPFNLSNTANYEFGNVTSGIVSATGNITTANYFIGNGAFLTGVAASYGNANVADYLASGTDTSNIITTGNITGGNVLTSGLISAAGNLTAANVNTGTVRNSSGTVTISTGSGDINLTPAGNIVLSANTYINNVGYPAQDGDAATKQYVDNLVSTAISYHPAVYAATTTTLAATTGGTITYAQPNGAGNGIGATLTTTGTFDLIDTANVQTAGTRILVKNEGNAVHNGIYTWSNATVITRSTDADEYGAGDPAALGLNDYFFVTGGNVNLGSAWIVDEPSGTITFGTSNIEFAQFSQSQVYSANTAAGLSLSGTVFSTKVDNNTTAFDGSGNIIVKASANLTTPNIGDATGTSLSVSGNVTGGNVLTGGLISSTGNVTSAANITGGNLLTTGLISATGNISSAGNISGTYFIGNGSLLTGIAGGGGSSTKISNGTSEANIGTSGGNANISIGGTSNVAVFANTGVYVTGLISASGNVIAGNIVTTGSSGDITGANLISGNTLTGTLNVTGGNILTGGLVSASGNVTGNYILGNGSLLTGVVTTPSRIINGTSEANIGTANGNANISIAGTSNVVVVASTGLFVTGVSSTSGNVTGGNITTAGLITAAGNITGGNILTSGTVSATSHIGSVVSITGNLTANNVSANTVNIPGTGGDITGANVIEAVTLNATYVNANTTTVANISGSGNVVTVLSGTTLSVVSNTVTANLTATTLAANISFANNTASLASFKGYSLITNALGSGAGSQTIDLTLGNYVTLTCTGITSFTFSNPIASPNASGFILVLTNGGNYSVSWPANTKWPNGTAPTLTTDGVDVLVFITNDGGTTWRGLLSMANSS